MKSPAHDIALWLVANSLASELGGSAPYSVNIDFEPAEPDACITVFNIASQGISVADTDEQDLFRPMLQIKVRSARISDAVDTQEVYDRAFAIRDAFEEASLPIITDDWIIILINPVSELVPVGRDDNQRQAYAANYQLIIQRKGE
jgi:hypothetical protein